MHINNVINSTVINMYSRPFFKKAIPTETAIKKLLFARLLSKQSINFVIARLLNKRKQKNRFIRFVCNYKMVNN